MFNEQHYFGRRQAEFDFLRKLARFFRFDLNCLLVMISYMIEGD